MMIERDTFPLSQAKFLAEKFRESATEGISEEIKNDCFSGYCVSFLMMLAVRYPEVRKEMEDRIVYRDVNK